MNQTPRKNWKKDPNAVRRDILRVARDEIAKNGLSGARIDEIAAKTKTSKRMIFYYFNGKDGLYQQVLENAYQEMREGELELDLEGLSPIEALTKLIEYTFDYDREHPDFIRLVMIENIHHGSYLEKSETIRELNKTAIDKLKGIYLEGIDKGVFREGIEPLALHWQISALSFFNVSNQATFALSFGDSMLCTEGQNDLRSLVVETVLRFVLKTALESSGK